MAHFGNYDEHYKSFSWSISEKELAYEKDKVFNIGWYCSDRICQMGKGDKKALIWDGLGGQQRVHL